MSTLTCGGCDATWTGVSRAHCAAAGCHQTFNSVSMFDRHRRGDSCVPAKSLGLEYDGAVWRAPHEGFDSSVFHTADDSPEETA